MSKVYKVYADGTPVTMEYTTALYIFLLGAVSGVFNVWVGTDSDTPFFIFAGIFVMNLCGYHCIKILLQMFKVFRLRASILVLDLMDIDRCDYV